MTRPGTHRRRNERGAVAVEVVLLVPALVLLLGVFVAGWRLWSARTQVTDAAASAARAATLETSGSVARARAHRVARTNLEVLRVPCGSSTIDVDVSGFARPPGQPAQVRVDVGCTVGLGDLLVPGLPGSWRVHGTASQTMDTFRERQP